MEKAIDFKIAGVTPSQIYANAKASNMFKWIGLYSWGVHVDIRNS